MCYNVFNRPKYKEAHRFNNLTYDLRHDILLNVECDASGYISELVRNLGENIKNRVNMGTHSSYILYIKIFDRAFLDYNKNNFRFLNQITRLEISNRILKELE
jgi:hypothetical protein